MKKSFIALTLTLLLLVSLFTVPAFAEKAPGCIHDHAAEGCELTCGVDEHIHDLECYDLTDVQPVCGKTEHIHIYEGESQCTFPQDPVCGIESDHMHSIECFTKLICEDPDHEHDEDSCYIGVSEPVCGEHAHNNDCIPCLIESHVHDLSCYDPEDLVLIEDHEEHIHIDACYENCDHVCDAECGVVPEQPANNGGTQFYPDYDENPAPAAPVESEAPVYVADEDASPKTGDPVSVSALVALMAAAAACVVFTARKVRG